MKDSELDLWGRHRQGDKAAREELILMYKYLIKHFVRRLCRIAYWAVCEDLMQEGVKGLIEAVDGRFDPRKGKLFDAYARNYIRGAVLRSPEFSRNLPPRQGEIYRTVRDANDKLMQELERKPTYEEIAEETGLSLTQIEDSITAMSVAFTDELPDVHMLSAVTSMTVEQRDMTILVREAIGKLDKKDAMILIRCYWNNEKDKEIAEKLGMKEDSLRKARRRAEVKLGKLLGVEKRK